MAKVTQVFSSFSRDQWRTVEKPVSEGTQCVLTLLVETAKCGGGRSNDGVTNLRSTGEQSYLEIVRPQLVGAGVVGHMERDVGSLYGSSDKTPKGKGGKGGKRMGSGKSRVEEIRRGNTNRIIVNLTESLMKGLESGELSGLLTVDVIEFRVLGLMGLMHRFLKSGRGVMGGMLPGKEYEGYRLAQSAQLVMEQLGGYRFHMVHDSSSWCEIAGSCLADLGCQLKILKDRIHYRCKRIFTVHPSLTDPANYYGILRDMTIRLNSGQKAMIETAQRHGKYLLLFNSNFGSGKTTTAIGVAAVGLTTPGALTIYCCMSEPVRYSLATYAYNSGIPFAIAVTQATGDVKVINNFRCKRDSDRKLVICDYGTARRLLCEARRYLPDHSINKITLIVDEPTDGADRVGHFKTRAFAELFAVAPSKTVLVSATLPSEEELKPFIEHYRDKYGCDGHIGTVGSREVKIGCQLIDREGKTFVCHQFVKTCVECERLLELLKRNQFLARLYTAPIVYDLYEKMLRVKIGGLFSLERYFSQVSNLNADRIAGCAIRLLERLVSTGDDELVEKILSQPVKVGHRVDLYGETAEDVSQTFEFDCLGTVDAHKFLGPTLLVSSDPVGMAMSSFESLVGGLDVDGMIVNYIRNREQEERDYAKRVRTLEKMSSSHGDGGMTRAGREREIAELGVDSVGVDIRFPSNRQINTREHLARYAPEVEIRGKRRQAVCLTGLPLQTRVGSELMSRMFAGVGVLVGEDHPISDADYTNAVIEGTLNGTAAYTVSDETVIFGVNSPADNLIIDDSVIEGRSMATVFQLLARVGRPGLSWTAYCYIGDHLRDKLAGYLTGGRIGIAAFEPEAGIMNGALSEVLRPVTPVLVERRDVKVSNGNPTFIVNGSLDGLLEELEEEEPRAPTPAPPPTSVAWRPSAPVASQSVGQPWRAGGCEGGSRASEVWRPPTSAPLGGESGIWRPSTTGVSAMPPSGPPPVHGGRSWRDSRPAIGSEPWRPGSRGHAAAFRPPAAFKSDIPPPVRGNDRYMPRSGRVY